MLERMDARARLLRSCDELSLERAGPRLASSAGNGACPASDARNPGALSLYLLLFDYRSNREPGVRARFSLGLATVIQQGPHAGFHTPSPEQLPDYRSHR